MQGPIPEKCINCIHHKRDDEYEMDYCDYEEYYRNGIPVPYPYFFKQEYTCKGHKERMDKCAGEDGAEE